MNRDDLIRGHEEHITSSVIANNGSFLSKTAAEAPAAADKVNHGEAVITRHSESELTRGMKCEIVDGFPVDRYGLKVNESIGVEYGDGAIGIGGDEVAREGKVRRSIKGKSGDSSGVLVEGTKRGGGGEVVEMDCVIGTAGSYNRTGDGDGFDEGEVGRIGEKRG